MNISDHPSHNLWRERFCLIFTLCIPLFAVAQTALPAAYTPLPPSESYSSIWQVIFSLLLVLAAVGLVAWIMKRINLSQHGTIKLLKVISSVAVGQRERVVVIEVNDTWLVVGVAPGQVRTLHSLPKSTAPISQTQNPPSNPAGSFQVWLKQMMEKRNAP